MTVALLARDLMIASRVAAAADHAGIPFIRCDDPASLPPPTQVRLLLVDWGDRAADWGERIAQWWGDAPEGDRPRVRLFGPHVDLAAHAAARAAGLGPMVARSRLIGELTTLFG